MSTATPDPDKSLKPGEVNPDHIPHDWPLTPLQGKKAYIPGWTKNPFTLAEIKKELKSHDFYKLFKPQLSPKEMLELGVFGGSYFGRNIKEYPKSWFKKAKISKNFNVNLNRFKVKSGLSRKEWQE